MCKVCGNDVVEFSCSYKMKCCGITGKTNDKMMQEMDVKHVVHSVKMNGVNQLHHKTGIWLKTIWLYQVKHKVVVLILLIK